MTVQITQVGDQCQGCADKHGPREDQFNDDVSYVEAFLAGDREGWALRQEYYARTGHTRQQRCQLWDNAELDKWIILTFKKQRVKEALTGDGINTIRVERSN
ncbi:hypothetical protein [Mycobacteroides abscessus]|uniref:hypothetical protein n=1 Tax=Mycobacteroides abscessus TaxID=36809 RepID=UPI0009CF8193|nr:hypothetical protein [Mycobacteroides abscessus]SLJ09494.1 Uncharacterised protein [Mycobacteroides abscessus subsp. abscessus]